MEKHNGPTWLKLGCAPIGHMIVYFLLRKLCVHPNLPNRGIPIVQIVMEAKTDSAERLQWNKLGDLYRKLRCSFVCTPRPHKTLYTVNQAFQGFLFRRSQDITIIANIKLLTWQTYFYKILNKMTILNENSLCQIIQKVHVYAANQ